MLPELYQAELRWLRESGRAFAAAHPDTARQLAEAGHDPDVERLLEGSAFLAARTRARSAEHESELVQALLLALAPHLVRPWPATTVVRFVQARGSRALARVRAGALLESAGGAEGPCRFRIAWESGPAWAEVAAIAIEPGDPPRLELRLNGALPPGREPPSTLRLHCRGEPALARALRLALLEARRIVAVLPGGGVVPLRCLPAGLDPREALLPMEAGPAWSHLLLAQSAACPDTLMFVDLAGPPGLGLTAGTTDLRVVVELATPSGDLAGVAAANLVGGCVPAVNLWPSPAEPIAIDGQRREHLLRVAGSPAALPWGIRRAGGIIRSGRRREWPHLLAASPGPAPRWQELRRASVDGRGSELWLAHCDPDAEAAGETLVADLLAHDGARAAALGAGEVRVPTGDVPGGVVFGNLDRPQPGWEPALRPGMARTLAARVRLAAQGVRDGEDLRDLLGLDDPRPADGPEAAERQRRLGAIRGLRGVATVEPLAGGMVRTLRQVVELDEDALGGIGGAHLLACVLARSLAALAPLNASTALSVQLVRSGRELVFPASAPGAEAG